MIPTATYRVQFHAGFTFADAANLAPYWARLGISHLYASPIATARRGSTHGYDVVDPTTINPALGGEPGFRAMVAALRAHSTSGKPILFRINMSGGHQSNSGLSDAFAQAALFWSFAELSLTS